MIIDIHTHAGRMSPGIPVNSAVLASMRPAGVAARVLPDFARYPDVVEALRARGMSAGEVAKVCAANWLRAFRAARGG